jgi:hypothetical protein
MSIVELQIPAKAILEIFEMKSVGTGMSCAIPGHATLSVSGFGKLTDDTPPLVPVVLTLGPIVVIDLVSSWLGDKLKRAGTGYIRIKGLKVEATAEGITKAIRESIDIERSLMVPDDESRMQPSVRPSLLLGPPKPDAEIVSDKDEIICLRVPPDGDMEQYVQGGAILKCSHCQSDVLVSPSTQRILAHGENQIVCMECWTEAHQPAMPTEEHDDKLQQLEICKLAGEQAYDDLFEKAHRPGDVTAYYSDVKESFYSAIGLARELGLEQEVRQLEERLAHIKAVFRSQFN